MTEYLTLERENTVSEQLSPQVLIDIRISKPCLSIQATRCQILSSHLPEALLIRQLHKHCSDKKSERRHSLGSKDIGKKLYTLGSASRAGSTAREYLTSTEYPVLLHQQQPGLQAGLEVGTELLRVSMFLS